MLVSKPDFRKISPHRFHGSAIAQISKASLLLQEYFNIGSESQVFATSSGCI
jgi:hypothetical protein